MSKKIKSLIVAGLLVVGMGGNVFAATEFENNEVLLAAEQGVELPKAVLKNLVPGETYTLQDGNITVKVEENKKYVDITIKDGSPVKVVKVRTNGYKESNVPEGTRVFVANADTADITEVEIYFELVDNTDSDGDGIPDIKDDTPNPPEQPEEPQKPEIVDPETYDGSMIAVGVGVVVAGGVLIVLNRKKDDDNEE